jgi:triosephosphate isomerase
MRRPFISANWKMNKTLSEAVEFLDAFLPLVGDSGDVDIVLAPPFTLLRSVGERLKGTNVMLSAQNVFYEEKGAYTGEVSPVMLKDIGCSFVIIGHSERRQYFGETDDTVNKKANAALRGGLGVILCIGETKKEREAGRTFDVLRRQLGEGMRGLSFEGIVIAYEPVWAIGTGLTATTEQAEESHAFIRGLIRENHGGKAEEARILYGGSVTPENIPALMQRPDVDGALVGGASLKAESFAKIVKYR